MDMIALKTRWDRTPEIRKEFGGSFAAYAAYHRNRARQYVRYTIEDVVLDDARALRGMREARKTAANRPQYRTRECPWHSGVMVPPYSACACGWVNQRPS